MNTKQFQELVDACASKLKKAKTSDRNARSRIIRRQCQIALSSCGHSEDIDEFNDLLKKTCKELGRRSAAARNARSEKKVRELHREHHDLMVKESIRDKLIEANEHICPVD